MLAISVYDNDRARVLLKRIITAGLERRPLPEIDDMAQDDCAGDPRS